jgi:hypothetical protein
MRRNYHKVSKIVVTNKHKSYVRKFRKSSVPKNRRIATTKNAVMV